MRWPVWRGWTPFIPFAAGGILLWNAKAVTKALIPSTMNRFYLLILAITVLLTVSCGSTKFVQETQPRAAGYRIKYDHRALRTPGNKFAIGLVVPADGTKKDTIGYPGKGSLGKYHIEADSGKYSGGKIKLRDSKMYKKGDSLTVNVYHRKWFLGGRGQYLTSRKIPYNFEDSISLITNSNSDKFPGGHVKFGVRTFYNDKQFAELWYPLKKKDKGYLLLGFEGGHLSTKKGDWKIDPDPTHISNDEVKLFASLVKAPAIRDTLGWMLDYKAKFQCNIGSMGDGHELNVSAQVFDDSIIHAKLLRLEVVDNVAHKTYHYLVNTQGGSIAIASYGASGPKGDDGQNGDNGQAGADGAISQVAETTTDTAGHTITTYVQVQGPGSDGGSGGDGADGENGYDGRNGGNITIYYTAAVAPYLKMIMAGSVPGTGGSGGNGGLAGNGGPGGNGNPPGRSGRSGRNGNSGLPGSNGSPGTVRFVAQ
jgi:hypothetical protein